MGATAAQDEDALTIELIHFHRAVHVLRAIVKDQLRDVDR
jgi:hypothetical protein